MTFQAEYVRCKVMTRAEFRQSGGCTWERQRDSPGLTLRIPSSTRFKIRRDGPRSHVVVSGICRDGSYEILEGDCAGQSLATANLAVSAVRSKVTASNAYLYVEFEVDGAFVLADQLRYDTNLGLRVDPVEEEALSIARPLVRAKLQQSHRDACAAAVEELAEIVLERNPKLLDRAAHVVRAREAAMADFLLD